MTFQYLKLMWYRALAELRVEAKKAYFGTIWWVLEPIFYIALFYLVFGVLFERGGKDFIAFLLCGIVAWRWFTSTVLRSATSIYTSAALISQVYLPKIVLPMIIVVSYSLKHSAILVLLLLFLAFSGYPPNIAWIALPIVLLVQLSIIIACSGLLSALVPLFPDLQIFIEHGMMLLCFISGIFYDIAIFPDRIQYYFMLNPIAVIIRCYRDILIEGAWPNWSALGFTALIAAIGIGIMVYLLHRLDFIYAKIVRG